MIAKKKSPSPQLRRWRTLHNAAWKQYRLDYADWKRGYDTKGREPEAPRFDDMVLKPLARFLNKYCFGGKAEIDIFGPQGIGARYTLDFKYRGRSYSLGVEASFHHDAPLLTIRRFDLKPKGTYNSGSIGELNCLNYPVTRVNQAEPADWWRKKMVITKEE